MNLKVLVPGAMGRMGRAILQYVHAQDGLEIIGATERHDHPDISKDVGKLLFGEPNGVSLENDIRNSILGVEAIVDFTAPEATMFNLEVAADRNIPIVIGTTGFTVEQLAQMREFSEKTRVVFAPNMSVGINVLWKMAAQVAKILGEEYDAEIVEAHHRHKADAPSGTALRLAEKVAEAWDKDAAEITDHGREGMSGEREYGRIGMHAVRGGDIVGEHTLRFLGEGETFELYHRATSRENFVKGAIRAALFLQKAEPGLYDMADVLGLN
jgi:4-hydroxy-tetrahydrodipicolinate reductase